MKKRMPMLCGSLVLAQMMLPASAVTISANSNANQVNGVVSVMPLSALIMILGVLMVVIPKLLGKEK